MVALAAARAGLGLGPLPPADRAALRAEALERAYRGIAGADLTRYLLQVEFPGRIAVASSFGAETAALLALVAEIDPATPVVFLDTGKLFDETQAYRRRLADVLGLTDVRDVRPDPAEVAREDPDGTLWQRDHDACCALRKVRPFERALAPFEAWISGRKRAHGGERSDVPVFDAVDGRVVISPLATWTQAEIIDFIAERDLPVHPLVFAGYLSIGCAPCTRPPVAADDPRSGRWAGLGKTECGIHRPGAARARARAEARA